MRTLLFVTALLAASAATAQPLWRSLPPGGLTADVLKTVPGQSATLMDANGNALGEANSTIGHTALILSTRLPVMPGMSFVAEAPFAFSSYDETTLSAGGVDVGNGTTSQIGLGNPYLGIAAGAKNGLSLEVGGRIPVFTVYGEGEAGRGGLSETTWAAANPEQVEAFMPSTYTLAARVQYEREVTEGLGIRADLAPAYLASTQAYAADGQKPSAVIARYGFQVTGEAGPFELAGGAIGREPLANDGSFVAEGSTAGIVSAVYDGVQFRPGVTVRVPVRGYAAGNAVVGLSLDVPLR